MYGPLAHVWLEQTTHNRWVPCSTHGRPPILNNHMEQNKKPVEQYYYSEKEWSRLGCGQLPAERDRAHQVENVIARSNPGTDGKVIKGSN